MGIFRTFLGRTEVGMASFTADAVEGWTPRRVALPASQPVAPFGLVDDGERSVAFWDAGELIGYGGDVAAVRMARAYARLAELGMPRMGAFGLAGFAREPLDRDP